MKAISSLAPESYYDSFTYNQEKEHVFKSTWIFVGFTEQLSSPDDFLTLHIGDMPIVVQNFNGELCALLNICSHRKATLQTARSGNRPLICPYHCWSYRNKGMLSGIPQNKDFFALDDEEKQKFSLKRFDLACCGSFVFVRIAETGPTLEEFLDVHYKTLQDLSGCFTETIATGAYTWQTNWKIAVETVLEVYHVPGTHPQSFAKLAVPTCDVISNPPHSIGNTPMQDSSKKWWKGVRRLLQLTCMEQFPEYNHFFIYPNLAIGLTSGSLMSVQTYEPVDATTCTLNFRLKLSKRSNDKPVSALVKNEVLESLIDFNHTTLEEDRLVAESCQHNMPQTQTPALLGTCEERLRLFHSAWRQHMEQS